MSSAVYEAVSYAMRFWFIFLIFAVLIAVIYISYKEFQERKYVKATVSELVGYVEIVGGPKEFIGDRFGVRAQNTIGSSQYADIMLPDTSVMQTHAQLYCEGEDIYLAPAEKSNTKINGRRAVNKHRLKTGDVFSIGDVDFAIFIKRTRLEHDH